MRAVRMVALTSASRLTLIEDNGLLLAALTVIRQNKSLCPVALNGSKYQRLDFMMKYLTVCDANRIMKVIVHAYERSLVIL